MRFRSILLHDSNRQVLRMQKSLELMNIKLHTVISDIVGQTGAAIIEAIVAGQRDAARLLPLVGPRIKADRDTIVKSLQGNWREEHLFTLAACYELYKYYKVKMEECDKKIEEQLQRYEALRNEGERRAAAELKEAEQKTPNNKKARFKNHPRFNVRGYLQRILRVDVLDIYGLSSNSGLQLLSECGTDMTK